MRNSSSMFVNTKHHSRFNSLFQTGTNFPQLIILEMTFLLWKKLLKVHHSEIQWQACIVIKMVEIIWWWNMRYHCLWQGKCNGKWNTNLLSHFGMLISPLAFDSFIYIINQCKISTIWHPATMFLVPISHTVWHWWYKNNIASWADIHAPLTQVHPYLLHHLIFFLLISIRNPMMMTLPYYHGCRDWILGGLVPFHFQIVPEIGR